MRRIRRNSPEPRLEMTPLLDVVFLLLTFFVFALLLMVRADVLGVSLPALGAAEQTSGADTITITIDEAGSTFVDGTATPATQVIAEIEGRLEENPEARLLLAVDARSRSAALMQIVNDLVAAGITDFALLGRSDASDDRGDTAAPASTNESAPAEAGAP